MHFAVFHGNERWILRGLAIDIETSLIKLGHSVNRLETDLSNPVAPPDADYYLFVQQGQLNTIHRAWGYKQNLLAKSICIFTHYDHNNANFKILNDILLVLHMSSQQMATAIANGLSAKVSFLCPLGFDPQRHFPLNSDYMRMQIKSLYPSLESFPKRHFIGFCTRLSKKYTYTRRKDYPLLFEVINKLLHLDLPILIIGDGWDKANIAPGAKNLFVFDPPYKHYNLFYNLMRVFCSVTSYDGGPIPLLESMSAGVFPVITNSGFAPDVIRSPDNGCLFQPFSDSKDVCGLVHTSYTKVIDKKLLRNSVLPFSFDSFSLNMTNKLNSL